MEESKAASSNPLGDPLNLLGEPEVAGGDSELEAVLAGAGLGGDDTHSTGRAAGSAADADGSADFDSWNDDDDVHVDGSEPPEEVRLARHRFRGGDFSGALAALAPSLFFGSLPVPGPPTTPASTDDESIEDDDEMSSLSKLSLAMLRRTTPRVHAKTLLLSRALVRLGRRDEAWEFLTWLIADVEARIEAVRMQPGDRIVLLRAYLAKGDLELNARRFKAAAALFHLAVKLNQKSVDAVARLAWSIVDDGGKPDKWHLDLMHSQSREPRYVCTSAMAQNRLRHYDESNAILKHQLFEVRPHGVSPVQYPEAYLLGADNALHGNDLNTALVYVSKALEGYPGSVSAHLLHAEILERLERPAAAAATLRAAALLAPDCLQVLGRLGMTLAHARRFNEALALLPTFLADPACNNDVAWVATVIGSKLLLHKEYNATKAFALFALSCSDLEDRTFVFANVLMGECLSNQKAPRAEAEAYLLRARPRATKDNMDSVLVPLGNLYREWGRLHEALAAHQESLALDGTSAQHCSNTAAVLEYMGRYSDGLMQLVTITKSNRVVARLQTMPEHIAFLIWTKLLFLEGSINSFMQLPRYLGMLKTVTPAWVLRLRTSMSTHWAYAYFIRSLLERTGMPQWDARPSGTRPPQLLPTATPRDAARFPQPSHSPTAWAATPDTRVMSWRSHRSVHRSLFVVGESHILSGAWRDLTWRGERRLLVPRLVTGLKVWHMQEGTEFLSHSALHQMLLTVDPYDREILFQCGEIDTREGISQAFERGKYPSLLAAIDATVAVYCTALRWLSDTYQLRVFVLPVVFPNPSKPQPHRWLVYTFNQGLRATLPATGTAGPDDPVVLLDYLDQMADPESGLPDDAPALLKDLHADDIHANAGIVRLIEAELNKIEPLPSPYQPFSMPERKPGQ